jgi:uncharacterized protein YutE (UPF0331/DUF86 family)
MVDDVILNKAATIERCIQRAQEEYQGFEDALQKMIGFRNIAAHDYVSLNLEIIQKIIECHLQDFQKFCQILIQKYCL